jgi:hypothetical protein
VLPLLSEKIVATLFVMSEKGVFLQVEFETVWKIEY